MSHRFLTMLVATIMFSGCSWQSYVVSRGIRHITGTPTRFHTIVPFSGELKQFRVIEVQPLDNLILGLLPPKMERYIGAQIFKELQAIKSRPMIIRSGNDYPYLKDTEGATVSTLVFEGYVDDYDAGYA